MSFQLIATTAEQLPLIRNLYQFYAYESSDWEQEDIEADGRFYVHDPYLALYWQRPGWSAQLILLDGFIAGFLLLERSEIAGVDAQEFADLFLLKIPPSGHWPRIGRASDSGQPAALGDQFLSARPVGCAVLAEHVARVAVALGAAVGRCG